MRQLSLSYGVYANHVAPRKSSEVVALMKTTAQYLLDEKMLTEDDLVAIVAGNFEYKEATFLEIVSIKKLLNEKRF